MYKNLNRAMNEEHVTYTQIAELLGKRYQTISDTANGSTKKRVLLSGGLQDTKGIFSKI